jgi:hypothetical protein
MQRWDLPYFRRSLDHLRGTIPLPQMHSRLTSMHVLAISSAFTTERVCQPPPAPPLNTCVRHNIRLTNFCTSQRRPERPSNCQCQIPRDPSVLAAAMQYATPKRSSHFSNVLTGSARFDCAGAISPDDGPCSPAAALAFWHWAHPRISVIYSTRNHITHRAINSRPVMSEIKFSLQFKRNKIMSSRRSVRNVPATST